MAALKPCGTPAAYRRHLRKGEDACADCKAAVRSSVSEGRTTKKREAAEARLKLIEPIVESEPDPLEVARDNLRIVEATLASPLTPAGSIASLTRRREELVEKILDLSGSSAAEVTTIDAADAGWSLEAL